MMVFAYEDQALQWAAVRRAYGWRVHIRAVEGVGWLVTLCGRYR